MKQTVCQQIQLLQNKYKIHKRFSIDSTSKHISKVKTQPEDQTASNLSDALTSLSLSKNWQSEYDSNFKRKIGNIKTSETERPMFIGKKYFDLSLYKAQTSYWDIERNQKINLKLPQLKSNFEMELYSETTDKKAANFSNLSQNWSNQGRIKKRALQKVDLIYASEQSIVDQKHQKIIKIKNRLKLLDRISKDKLKLQQKITTLQNL